MHLCYIFVYSCSWMSELSQTTTCIQKRKLAQNNIIDGEGMVKVYALKKIIIIIYVHQVDELQTKG